MVYDFILPSYGPQAIRCHPGGWNLAGEPKIYLLAAPLNKVPLGLPFGSNVRAAKQTRARKKRHWPTRPCPRRITGLTPISKRIPNLMQNHKKILSLYIALLREEKSMGGNGTMEPTCSKKVSESCRICAKKVWNKTNLSTRCCDRVSVSIIQEELCYICRLVD